MKKKTQAKERLIKQIYPDLWYIEEEKKHHYWDKHPDTEGAKRYTGVTTLTNSVMSKPFLVKAAVGVALDYLQDHAKDGKIDTDLLKEAKTAHEVKWGGAADFGKEQHKLMEAYIRSCLEQGGMAQPSDTVPLFAEWAINKGVRFVATEWIVYSKELWLAGTLDFLCEIEGKRYVGDYKTSTKISYDYMLQTAAYAYLMKEPIEGTIIVRAGKGGMKWLNGRKQAVDPKDDFEVLIREQGALKEDVANFGKVLDLYRARQSFGEEV